MNEDQPTETTVAAAEKANKGQVQKDFLGNTNGPAYGSIPVYAGQAGAGSGGTDLVSQNNIMAFLLPFTETLNYDADGDLLLDGQWSYTWDAEHRLIAMDTNAAAQAAGLANTQIQFTYDYLGRRTSKSVTVGSGQATVTQYVYFGWNVAAELDGSGNLKRHFIWGLDRSGSIGGLGGIGGLLMIQDSGNSYFPAYDGSANVAGLIVASTGAYAATYEYSPFGELLRKQGSYAVSNPYRFSTKWWDEETSLSYYGRRYYNSALGRFINRDPIEESGGINLYAFCGNSPMNGFDMLGNCDDDDDDDGLDTPAEPANTVNTTGGAFGFTGSTGSGLFGTGGGSDNAAATQASLDFASYLTSSASTISGLTFTDDFNAGLNAGFTGNFAAGLTDPSASSTTDAASLTFDPTSSTNLNSTVSPQYSDMPAGWSIMAPNNGGGGFWSSLGSSLLSGLSQDLAAVNNYVLQPFNAGVNQLATGVGNLVDDVLPGAGSGVSNLINFAPAAAIAMATDGTSLLAEEAGSLAAESGAAAPDFIVSSGGTVYPVPEGATGPFPVESGNGFQYVGGSGGNGLDPSVSNVRLMDPTAPSGPSPGYPNGYGSYSNGAIPTPQTVNPYTGQTVSPSSPWWHIGAD